MNNSELRAKVIETVAFYTDLGNETFKTNMATPNIDFSLKGRVGGKYSPREHMVKVNMILLAENAEDYLESTIPHEVAHGFQRHIYGQYQHGRRIMPHGYEWKRIMLTLGKNPKRTHSYDVSNATQRTVAREFAYRCHCKTHMFTIIRHRRAQKSQAGYRCKRCGHSLSYVGNKMAVATVA